MILIYMIKYINFIILFFVFFIYYNSSRLVKVEISSMSFWLNFIPVNFLNKLSVNIYFLLNENNLVDNIILFFFLNFSKFVQFF